MMQQKYVFLHCDGGRRLIRSLKFVFHTLGTTDNRTVVTTVQHIRILLIDIDCCSIDIKISNIELRLKIAEPFRTSSFWKNHLYHIVFIRDMYIWNIEKISPFRLLYAVRRSLSKCDKKCKKIDFMVHLNFHVLLMRFYCVFQVHESQLYHLAPPYIKRWH